MSNTNEENKNTGSETGGGVLGMHPKLFKHVGNKPKTIWKKIGRFAAQHYTVTGLVLYLYFSAVGYVYDYVYYSHYGLDILKYERPEDYIFSIFHHGMLIIAIPLTILLTIILLIFLGFLLKEPLIKSPQ